MLKDVLVVLLLSGGTFFFIVGTVGLIRLPDVFTRIHATTKCDTLGAGLLLLGLLVYQGLTVPGAKLVLILGFLWLTNPTGSHLLARAVYWRQQVPVETFDYTKEG